ncbi:MAG: MATE family efflux transporter [Oscillospiraceae bacterium]
MKNQRARKVANYVIPTVLSQCAFFLFTIVDGVFVGNGVGTDALGAVNLAMPFIMVIGAAFMLTTIGGVTVAAIRLGRGDIPGANQAFMHSLGCTAVIATVFSVIGIMFTRPLAALLGADWNYIDMVCDYLLWYSIFTLPAAISTTLQGFGRNDGAPVFVMASTIVSTALNIFLDWLFVSRCKRASRARQ